MSDDKRGELPDPIHPTKPRISARRRIPAILASSGAVASLLGIFVGRGTEQGMGLILARIFLLVIGFSVFIAGVVGLAARAPRGSIDET